MPNEVTVTQLWLYPLKSCRGIKVQRATIGPTGFALDRQWVVCDSDGKFITQRQQPRLALVETSVTPDEALRTGDAMSCPDAVLVMKAPGMPKLQVPLAPAGQHELVPCTVWDWSGSALDEGPEAAQWFSQYLGKPCKLLRYAGTPDIAAPPVHDAKRREVDREWAAAGTETAFADGFPFLLASEVPLGLRVVPGRPE